MPFWGLIRLSRARFDGNFDGNFDPNVIEPLLCKTPLIRSVMRALCAASGPCLSENLSKVVNRPSLGAENPLGRRAANVGAAQV